MGKNLTIDVNDRSLHKPLKNSKKAMPYSKENRQKRPKNNKFVNCICIILYVILGILAAIVVALFTFNIFFKGIQVSGESMWPTLDSGDFLYMQPKAKVTRGDIVVVRAMDENGNILIPNSETGEAEIIIKRVIGLEGDRLYTQNGTLWRQSGSQNPQDCGSIGNYANFQRVTVMPGQLFLCGDNREHSLDSRAVGTFPVKELQGVVANWSVKNKSILTKIYNFFNPPKGENRQRYSKRETLYEAYR